MTLSLRCRPLFVPAACLLLLGGCNESESSRDAEERYRSSEFASANSPWTGNVAEAAALPSPQETYNTALILGDRALQTSHSAQSLADWQQAAGEWERALNLLRAIPAGGEYFDPAQAKIEEYEAQLLPIHQQLERLRG